MRIIFPSWPGRRQVDDAFELQLAAAQAEGFEIGFVDLDMNLGGEVRLWNVGPSPVIYRGWILKVSDYERFAEAVASRGGTLATSAEAYRYACDFPSWYKAIEGHTPQSVWFPKEGLAQVIPGIHIKLFNAFGGFGGLIVKDYVKSRKHEWYDACYIPDLQDEENIKRVTRNFVDLQGDSFTGGLVFRTYMPFKRIGTHPRSKLPLVNEWRAFLWDGKLFYMAPYWSEEEGASYKAVARPDPQAVERMGKDLKVRFCALDVAELEDGTWLAIEVNDGGTAGIPGGGNAQAFYAALKACLADNEPLPAG